MEPKAVFKYYITRVGNTVIIRRTSKRINQVKSMLYSKMNPEYRLVQLSYTGGKAVGTIHVSELAARCKMSVAIGKCHEISWSKVKALKPFLQKGE